MRKIVQMMSVSLDGFIEGSPVLIGRGAPLFRPADEAYPLRLVETRTFGNGVVLLRHQRPDPR